MKIFFIIAGLCLCTALSSFAQTAVSVGADFGNCSITTSDSSSSITVSNQGAGIKISLDTPLSKFLLLSADGDMLFGNQFDFASTTAKDASTFDALVASTLLFTFPNVANKITGYLGGGVAIISQSNSVTVNSTTTKTFYMGYGLCVKGGVRYYLSDKIGINLSIIDAFPLISSVNTWTTGSNVYDLKSSNSSGNVFIFSIGASYKF